MQLSAMASKPKKLRFKTVTTELKEYIKTKKNAENTKLPSSG